MVIKTINSQLATSEVFEVQTDQNLDLKKS